jgi:hypothetical protein
LAELLSQTPIVKVMLATNVRFDIDGSLMRSSLEQR